VIHITQRGEFTYIKTHSARKLHPRNNRVLMTRLAHARRSKDHGFSQRKHATD
jgi:hypothetical protein